MSIIQQDKANVNIAGVFSLVGEDRATLESDLSAPISPPIGESTSAIFVSDNTFMGGSNAINSSSNLSEGQPLKIRETGLDGLDSINCDNVDITAICRDFDNYIKELEGSQKLFAHIKNEAHGLEAICMIDRISGSRYFPEGRAKIRRKIQKRIKKKKEKGIYLVMTVDTKRYSLIEAWDSIWENFKLWHDAINVYRKRHMGAQGSLRYVAVLEQHKSGYPHLNVFFPSLRVLTKQADFNKINDYWNMGSVEIERERKPESACSYVLKYISKLEGWTKETFAILWHYKVRIWNMSHCWYEEKKPSGWVLVDIYKSISFEHILKHFGVNFNDLEDVRFVLINSS